jgi:prepilin-type processing-associated H-X9-DG protein
MADRPPFREKACGARQNSPNHGGQGQNVLFTDGHVEFLTQPTFAGANIYLNRKGQARAGVSNDDNPLGMSEMVP